ncbi:MAG: hypothetical protein LC128_11975 [Chitinophagales bacterium]|nr:hypothetical protein [Chitinophagales bacterium]
MILEISDTRTLADIREEFSGVYPFLSFEFYQEPHEMGEATPSKQLLPHHKRIGDIRKQQNSGILEIYPQLKTGSIEQEFKRKFGLHVQILRRHGNAWIQTAGTDELTLGEQNEIGRNSTLDSLQGSGHPIKREKHL